MQDSIYRLRQRDLLTICVLALLFMGIIMVQSAGMTVSTSVQWAWAGSLRHIIYAAAAMGVFFIIGHVDYDRLRRAAGWRNPILWFFGVTVILCVLVLIPHIGLEVNGARRWLPLGPIQVQPSELAKWAVVLFLAWWLTQRTVPLDRFGSLLLTLVPVGLICLLVVVQDFGTAALIGLCTVTMLLCGRVKWWHVAILLVPALAAACWFVMHKDYRMRRIMAFLNPYAAPRGEGYHMIQSLLSFSTGGLFGKGLGNGIQKLGYLPEDTTDFIFAVICEELGLFGALLVVSLFLGILYIAWTAIRKKRDSFGQMLAFGIASMIGLQALINIAVATVSVPTKGLSLPLVSAGGSGLIITCAALGLLYSVVRFNHDPEEWPDEEPAAAEPALPISKAAWEKFAAVK